MTVDYCGTSGFLTELFQLTQRLPFATVIRSAVNNCGDGNLLMSFRSAARGHVLCSGDQGPDATVPYTMTISTSPCGTGVTPPNDEMCGRGGAGPNRSGFRNGGR